MKIVSIKNSLVLLGITALILGAVGPAGAEYNNQCPDHTDGSRPYLLKNGTELNSLPPGTSIEGGTPLLLGEVSEFDSNVCMHVTGSDGFSTMADDQRLYVFGFKDQTGKPMQDTPGGDLGAIGAGVLGANQPSPEIELNEGDNFFLTLSNPGMVVRPDLFDPHTIHYHGFPNASGVFDGVPEMSLSINQESSITYFYNNEEPGTFAWHCHVEATEHMQMGMLGALSVKPRQNRDWDEALPTQNAPVHIHTAGDQYVYNDEDGDTHYDVEKTLLLGALDGQFHIDSETVQPLPFALMDNNYPTINGRGYPDTVSTTAPLTDFSDWSSFGEQGTGPSGDCIGDDCRNTQPIHSIVTASAGDTILLRLVNLDVTRAYTVQLSGGLKFNVVGRDARINRGKGVATDTGDGGGKNLAYKTSSIDVDGGTTHDVLIDTTGIPAGTYVFYTTNMNYLSNNQEDFGGMMTTITIN